MKKLPLLILACCFLLSATAQVNNEDQKLALELIKSNQQLIGLTDDDLANTAVSSTYETLADHIRMVYLQQTFRNIPVFNQMQVLAFKNGKLVSASGGRIANMSERVNNLSASPVLTAADAVRAAMTDRKLAVQGTLEFVSQKGSKILFNKRGIAFNDIAAELVWLPVSSKQIVLTWEVDLEPLKSQDHWMIRVDAASGKVLDKNNLTVYEQFDHLQHAAEHKPVPSFFNLDPINRHDALNGNDNSPLIVSSATYRVIPFPAESPIHPGGTATLVTDPWTLSSGNAVSLQWHNDGTTYHDSTRGNNVWAQEDRDNNNVNGKAGISSTPQPNLTLDFAPNFTLAPTTTTNQQYGITNLFYWNNIMHDISYLYGFDEPSGNFQNNNQGRGGAGNDYVVADAQDAAGTNNANFSTPVDGSKPRMQMYLFTTTTPNRDGDLDNGVINHEYGHGISNRLTGGPANSSCLSNAEQGGEGWSDYMTLMTTTNWATAQVTDGALPKPMGTYVLGQAITGAGIRTYPYSTNMSINPWTYASLAGSGGEVHVIGEIWCMALWEMTWEMIAQDGINPNLFNPSATGGNTAALKLVMEGMRLQPCSPGYIDARNAILKADTLFFGAKYSCSIWKAFAKRGMGKLASQGSSNSTTDQVASFVDNGGLSLLLTQNVTSQQEGLNITYTNHVNAGTCGSLTNYILTDTLPLNVTYVSGGTYNAGNRVVSFPVNLAQGASQDYSFTVSINPGSYFPPQTILDEQVTGTAGTIPTDWTAASTTTSVWTTHNTRSHTAPNSLFTPNRTTVSDQTLTTTNTLTLGANPPNLSFWHWYNAESGWDGGVVEISTNGGTSWSDLGSKMTANGYNSSLGSSTSPLSGRSAFTGNSGAFIKTTIDLSTYANQSVKIRFRFASDASLAVTGWNIDDIFMQSLPVVNMRSNLFNNLSIKVAVSDTVTNILPGSCVTGSITSQPSNASVCAGANASYTVAATGTSLTYQWQVSTDGGSTFINIGSATDPTLNLSSVTLSMNNNVYRCEVSGTCTAAFNSNAVTLTVNSIPDIPGGVDASRCGAGTLIISATAASGETIDWYAVATGGTPLVSGALSYTTPVLSGTTTYFAESRNTTSGCISASRTSVNAIINAIVITPGGTGAARCGSGIVTISATPGIGETIDWYTASSGGSLLQSASLSFTTPVINISTTYYAQARNFSTGCLANTRTPVTATVNAVPATAAGSGASRCGSGTLNISATAGAGETIDWYAAAVGGSALVSGSLTFTTPVISNTTTYFAESRNTTSGCVSATRTAVNAVINNIVITPSGTGAARCGAGSVTITANPGIGETIDWYSAAVGGSLLQSGSTSFVTPLISSTTVYYAQARNITTGCLSNTLVPVTATIQAIPAAPAAGNSTGCGAGTISILAVPGIGETIDWYASIVGGTAFLSGSTSYVTPPLTSTTTYFAVARNIASGCISTSRTPVTATVVANTSSSTPITICATQLPYVWNNNSYNVGGVFTVHMMNAAGCDSAATLLLDIAPAITAYAVTGGGSYQTGGSGVAVGVSNSQIGISYQLRLDGNDVGLPVIGSGSSISFGNQIAVGNYTVFATSPYCQQMMTGSVTVTITSGPPTAFAVTGGGTYCTGGAGVAIGLAGSEAGVNYQLQRSNGTINVGSPVAGTGAAISFGNQTTASDYSVLATNTTTLSTQAMLNYVLVRIAMIRTPSAPGAITGPADACPYIGNAPVTYTIRQAANATSYLWSAPAGATIIGSNTDTIVQIQYPVGFISGILSVASINACFNNASSSARSLSITKKIPSTPGTITPSLSNPCSIVGSNATATYTIRKVTNATAYAWTLSPGIVLVSGLGDTGIVVRFNAGFTTGSVSVVASNVCSVSAARTLAVTSKAPSAPAAISGPNNVCIYIGQPTTATYTIAAVSGAASYLWTVPANATIVSGQGTTSIEVSFAANFTGGSLTVRSVAGCGNSSARAFALVKNIAKPGAITASAPACPSTQVTYSIAAVPFATSYIWSVPGNATYVSGQGTTSFTVSYQAGFVSGTVTVKSVNGCSTSAVSSLAVNASECVPLPKFTKATIPVTDPAVAETNLVVYPNPASGVVNVKVASGLTLGNVQIQLINMFGKVVLEKTVAVQKDGGFQANISVAALTAGIYQVRYAAGKQLYSEKLVVVK